MKHLSTGDFHTMIKKVVDEKRLVQKTKGDFCGSKAAISLVLLPSCDGKPAGLGNLRSIR